MADPQMQDVLALADRLHRPLSEILAMTEDEFILWSAYFSLRADQINTV